ncbi:MAG: hypothetical protein WA160_15505 [Pseudobdellovibrio sp.]
MPFKMGLLVVVVNFALFSCAPKDDKLVRPDTGFVKTNATPTSDEAVKLLFISIDRSVEALHFLKAALNNDYAIQKKIDVFNVDQKDLILKKQFLITSEKVENDISNQSAQINLISTIELEVDQTIKSVVIQDINVPVVQPQKEAAPADKQTTRSVKNMNKIILVTKSAQPGFYDLEINSLDETNSKENGNGMSNTFAKFTIAWDGKAESLMKDIVITSGLFGHNKYGVTKFIAKSVSVNLIVSLSAECASVNGTISLTSSGKPEKNKQNEIYQIQIQDSSIKVQNKTLGMQAAQCSLRPVVDLRKLF